MPPRVNLHDPDETIRWLVQQVESLQQKVTASYTSITRGALRVASAEGLIVDGSARVNGTLIITGEQQIAGELHVTGTLIIDGPTTITGEFVIDGNTTITGQVDITGDVLVTGDGKIVVGNMTLDPSSNGGSLKFTSGPEVYASGSLLALYTGPGGAYATLDGTQAEIHGPSVVWIRVTATDFQVIGLPTSPQSTVPDSFVGAITWTPSGWRRIVAG